MDPDTVSSKTPMPIATTAATTREMIGRVTASLIRSTPALRLFSGSPRGGRDHGDPDNVLVAAAACELHPKALLAGVESRSVKESLRAATDEAAERSNPPVVGYGNRA